MASQHASITLPSFDASRIDWDVVADIIDEVPEDADGIDALDEAHERVVQRLDMDPSTDDMYYRLLLKIHEIKAPTLRQRFEKLLRAVQTDDEGPAAEPVAVDPSKVSKVERWLATTAAADESDTSIGFRPSSSTPIKDKVPFLDEVTSEMASEVETDVNAQRTPLKVTHQQRTDGFQPIRWDEDSLHTLGYTLSKSLIESDSLADESAEGGGGGTVVGRTVPAAYGGPVRRRRNSSSASSLHAASDLPVATPPIRALSTSKAMLQLENEAYALEEHCAYDTAAMLEQAVEFCSFGLKSRMFRNWLAVFEAQTARAADNAAQLEHAKKCRLFSRWTHLRDRRQRSGSYAERIHTENVQHASWTRWRQALCYRRQDRLADELLERRVARQTRTAFDSWLGRVRNKAKEKWMMEMGRKEADLKARRERTLLQQAFNTWHDARSMHAAIAYHEAGLMLSAFATWRFNASHRSDLRNKEGSLAVSDASRLLRRSFGEWRRRRDLREREEVQRQKVEKEIAEEAWQRWRGALATTQKADDFRERSALQGALRVWLRKRAAVQSLAKQAHSFEAAKAAKLSQAALLLWTQAHRVRVAQKKQMRDLLSSALLAWSDKMAVLRRHQALADSIETLRSQEAARQSLQKWKARLRTQSGNEQKASDVATRNALDSALRTWRQRLEINRAKSSEAIKARAFFLQKEAFGTWAIRYRRRKQEQWVAQKSEDVVRRAFKLWHASTDRERQIRLLEKEFNAEQSRHALVRWMGRLADLTDKRQQVDITRSDNLRRKAFDLWSRRTIKLGDNYSLMLSFRAVKDREDLGRLFTFWRSATARKADLEERERQLVSLRAIRAKKSAIEQWIYRRRERAFTPALVDLQERKDDALLYASLARWQTSSRRLAALRFESVKLKTKAWTIWRQALPEAQRMRKLRKERDLQSLGEALALWKAAYRARVARRAAARQRGNPELLRIRSSVTPPSAPPPPPSEPRHRRVSGPRPPFQLGE